MPFSNLQQNFLLACIEDKYISFNFKRPKETFSALPRTVITLPFSPTRKTVVPGIQTRKERLLTHEIRKKQSWKKVKKDSFEMRQKLFSFLWKYSHPRHSPTTGQLKDPSLLTPKETRKVRSALKSHWDSIELRLRPGNVFLIPDSEITFNDPNRYKQVYARPVLVFALHGNQVVIMPFSTRIDMMNKETDILFDTEYNGAPLSVDQSPAVENYPYGMFKKKNVLCVNAFQSVMRPEFLMTALTSMGAVRIEVLECAKKRMKKSLL